MKKIIVIAIALFTAAALYAQPRAIGGRIGYGLELSYQHSLGDNMVQLDFGLPGFYGLEAAATYDWIFPINSWQEQGSWNWYAGVGAGLGSLQQCRSRIQHIRNFPRRHSLECPLPLLADIRHNKRITAV